ncbi:hypothetical protein OSB04_026212 [Centaurea solstitialis]|uniref:very-long-chain 3-oxoacyl-CoA synthase n=1 Tax=Centaurea solstitialis TaxID=347529 RepID=A0AA38W930_9ASTR|nr:hypothetical protein OSB04_026212 [Centaurea solstitialis]
MGCSASALAVDMAGNLLKVHENSNAVILSTEILSNGWYAGKNRSMMVLNCVFRSGGAAILITNKKSARNISKYKLLYSLRTQGAFDDKGYNSAIREEDSEGITGVTLRKDVLHVAGELLRSSFRTMGSSILPLEEKIRYGLSVFTKRFLNQSSEIYVPNFGKAIQHYCLPASGKAVIMEIAKNLKLKDEEIEAPLMTLHRFGNQSSSSLWYELAYMEAKGRVKEGDRVLQLGMGSGPKCNSLIWECNRPIIDEAHKGPWADRLLNMIQVGITFIGGKAIHNGIGRGDRYRPVPPATPPRVPGVGKADVALRWQQVSDWDFSFCQRCFDALKHGGVLFLNAASLYLTWGILFKTIVTQLIYPLASIGLEWEHRHGPERIGGLRDSWRVASSSFLEHSKIIHSLDQQGVDFLSRVLESEGQSEQTSLPPSLHYIPPTSTHEEAINEARSVLFPVFEDLLSKTRLSTKDIDILIVNCSGFCPSPSLSSIVINKYSLRHDVKSFNISGMGCSASALAVHMAGNLLKVHENSNVVILSTEILSKDWYAGKDRLMMVLNCLFRSGGAALLITNKRSFKKTSKYRLLYALRAQGAFDDKGYSSVIREEDSEGFTGVTLRKDGRDAAHELFGSNFHILGSYILPLEEKVRYGFSVFTNKFLNQSSEIYVPNFSKTIRHYCLPISRKSIIMEIRKKLKLKDEKIEAALMTLHRFGSQSSSSLWYELAYMEAKERVKEGDRVLQLGMGTGPKCNSLVWECNRPIINEAHKGPWVDNVYRSFRIFLLVRSHVSHLNPPNSWRVPFSSFLEHSKIIRSHDQQTVDFLSKVLTTSGQSEQTYLPPSLHYIPPTSTHEEAVNEARLVLFPVFEDLLSKTRLSPRDIDIIIVNCIGFCPSPSLSSIVINNYSLRHDVKSFNISGMGCSASAIAVDMAQNLLKVHENSNVVILSTEILSKDWYAGKDRTMMILNCVFRSGSAAVLITNKRSAKRNSKYRLIYTLRTQGAFDDKAYNSAIREEDSEGFTGVTLRKDGRHEAEELLGSHFQIMGSSILPLQEKIRYGFSTFTKKFLNQSSEIYVPNFGKAIQHYCLPVSRKSIIMEIGKKLKLKEEEMEAALMTLHRFGSQSSSSLWYELAYMEAKGRVKEGDRVLQLGMGSGPKCSSLIWECNRPIINEAHKGPWADCIHSYPV